jgi:hypothetical protein
MGIGFYLMVAAAVVMYKIAEADKRRGWLWSGIVVCIIMLLGEFTDVGLVGILIGFCLAFLAMFIANVYFSAGKR